MVNLNSRTLIWSIMLMAVCANLAWANSPPAVSNVSASQRGDDSGIVDIYYTLADADNDKCTVSIAVSNNDGSTWTITPSPSSLSGYIGSNIYPGNRYIVWNSKTDLPGAYGTTYRVKVTADDGFVDGPAGMVWVSINDPGVSGHEGFNGQMSRYETTNAQYCEYLNAALASGDVIVSGNYVVGNSGPYSGEDYYRLDGPGYTTDGATNGGAARINWTGSSFTVDSGFENHPVTYVSWYGSTSFASYYGWRLPTEWEWQAVADHNGSYTYGCGTTIDNSIANYRGSIHPYGTTAVGAFGISGYGMCDMAGNVWEWTSSLYDPESSYRVLRGGCWGGNGTYCTVAYRYNGTPNHMYGSYGFRVCR